MAKVMVVDDLAVNRELIVTLLNHRGHQPLEAADGAEALALVRAERPELVISDILMPTMDGYEFVRQLRSDPALAATEVIFCSAHYRERETRNLAKACGVSRVLIKPCEPEDILRAIDEALAHAPEAIAPRATKEFEREHLRLMTDKLSEKVAELEVAHSRLAALTDLNLQLASERDSHVLLVKVCRSARDLIGAKYAVLCVNGKSNGEIYVFTSGIESAAVAGLQQPEVGCGRFGEAIAKRCACRFANPGGEASAAGLPAGYPPLHSGLIAPIVSLTHAYGWICLADKLGSAEFSDEDEQILSILAAQVGRIYENGSLYKEMQKQAELLRISESRFRQMADNITDVFFLQSLDGTEIFYVSPAYEHIWGRSCESLYLNPASWADAIHPDDLQLAFTHNSEGRNTGFDNEFRIVRPDGETRWIYVRGFPILDAFGNPYRTAGICSDITLRKLAADELHWSDGFKRAILESSPDSIIAIDHEGKIVEFNVAAEVTFGLPYEDAIGKALVDLIVPPQLREAYKRGLAHYLATGSGPILGKRLELTAIRADGTEFPIELTVAAIGGASKPLFTGFIRDITVQQADQNQLRESESRFRSLTSLSSDWFWEQDQEYRFVAFSGGDREGGWGGDQLNTLGLRRWELPGVTPVDEIWQEHKSLLEERKPFRNFEYDRTLEDGTRKYIAASGEPVFDAGGRFTGYRGVATDITERKRAEYALRKGESEQRQLAVQLGLQRSRLVAAQRVAKIGSWETDLVTMCVIWSDETHRIFETDSAAFHHPTHEAFIARVHPDDRAAVDDAFSDSLGKSPTDKTIQHRLLMPDGRIKFVEERWRLNLDEFEQPVNVIGTCQDITERKQAEITLQESRDRLALATRSAHIGIWDWEVGTKNVVWDAQMYELYGLRDQAPGDAFEAWRKALHPDDRGRSTIAYNEALGGREDLSIEFRIVWPTGEVRDIESHFLVHRADDGSDVRLIGVNWDITERKRNETEIRRLNVDLERRVEERTAELQAANRELEAFDYSIAHDLMAPIRHIGGFSSILAEEYGSKLDARGRDLLERMQGAGHRMDQLVGDLLALSVVSRREMHRTRVDLSALALLVFAGLQHADPSRDIECMVAPGLTAIADLGQIRIVLENLIGNARKFTAQRSGARIEFGSTIVEETAVFFVRDNGAGFESAWADRLFTPFQRLHTESEFKGTGIGLATVMRIVARHGGKAWAEGKVNEGATFYFTLPS